MSQSTKLVLGVAVAVLVLGGGYAYWNSKELSETAMPGSPEVSTLPSGTATTDTALDTDLQAVDAQLQLVDKDNANTKSSIDSTVAR